MMAGINPKAARMVAGLTQEQAAAVIGATRRAWQEWEGGRRNMPPSKFALFTMLVSSAAPHQSGPLNTSGPRPHPSNPPLGDPA